MKNKTKPILSTGLGNIFEAYDFIIFGFMLKYIKDLFLPDYDVSTKYILSFLLFSVGYIGRPLGAYILGNLGNRIGRRLSILASIIILTISTCLVGFLPTYREIGMLAPILLIILRLIQNFSISIEQVGGAIYLIESFPKNKRYFVSSFIFGNFYLGNVLGLAVVILMVSLLTTAEIKEWGWRIPFILSFPMGCLTAWLRLNLAESIEFSRNKNIKNENKIELNKLIHAITVFMSLAGTAYLTVIYIPNMLLAINILPVKQVFIYSILSNIAIFFFAMLSGIIVDKGIIAGKKLQKIGLIANIILSLPIYLSLTSQEIIYIVCAQVIASCLLGIQAGTVLGATFDFFKFKDRFLIINLGFNIAMTFFGGLSPFIVAYLSNAVHVLSPAIYLIILSSISLLFLYRRDKSVCYEDNKGESFVNNYSLKTR